MWQKQLCIKWLFWILVQKMISGSNDTFARKRTSRNGEIWFIQCLLVRQFKDLCFCFCIKKAVDWLMHLQIIICGGLTLPTGGIRCIYDNPLPSWYKNNYRNVYIFCQEGLNEPNIMILLGTLKYKSANKTRKDFFYSNPK